jgi:DNA-binding NarL/FixJ family response regulator
MIRILIVDDRDLERKAYRAILRKDPDIEIVGEGQDGEQAIELVRQLAPDVVLMDINMPICDGLQATRRIRVASLDTKVLVAAASSEDDLVLQAFVTGVDGYISKFDAFAELSTAIHTVQSGKAYMGTSISTSVRNEILHSS